MIILINDKEREVRKMDSNEKLDTSLKLHHQAVAKGYVSRKCLTYIGNYAGKYGEGIILVHPRFDSSRFVNIEYYVGKADT